MDIFHNIQGLALGAGGNQQSTTFAIGRNQSIGKSVDIAPFGATVDHEAPLSMIHFQRHSN